MTTIDDVYAQRNELAIAFAKAALAAGWKAGRGIDSEASPEWANVVYVDLPDGRQVSWHISTDCVPLLDGLPQYAGTWDGTFIGREAGWSRGIEAVAPNRWEGDHNIESPFNACMHKSYCMTLKRARVPLAQQAEPVEPFGYWFSDKHQDAVCSGWFVRSPCDGKLDGKPGVPLYTAPPQRKQAEPAQEPITRLFGTLPVHDTQQAEPVEPVATLIAQRDALLEALKLARPYINSNTPYGYHAEVKADAAIKAVEEVPHGVGQR